MNSNGLKHKIREYWNSNVCGSKLSKLPKFSQEYFNELEEIRYKLEPEIYSFAQFTRFHGKKVLEIGIGAGSDFIQWVRAGAKAYGIDLSESAVQHTLKRLELTGLIAEDVRVDDVENLSYEDNFFDLVYSWGVIHHTPDTEKALKEIIRVTKPGGSIKLMLYHKYSIYAFLKYLKYGLLKFRPLRKINNIIYFHQESLGTKAF